jgi:hypothetical protein
MKPMPSKNITADKLVNKLSMKAKILNKMEKRSEVMNEYFLIVNTLFRHYLSRDLYESPLR